MPKAFKIANAMSLPQWWVYQSFHGKRFTRCLWWKPKSLLYQDDDAAYASRFAGTFVNTVIPERNMVCLWPYEFKRHMISQSVIWLLRNRLLTFQKIRKWRADELPMSPSTMATRYLGCTPSQLVAHLESLMKGEMSWGNQREWHIDHIQPLCRFDLRKPEDAAVACHFTNLQPLWRLDNLKKGGRFTEPAHASQH